MQANDHYSRAIVDGVDYNRGTVDVVNYNGDMSEEDAMAAAQRLSADPSSSNINSPERLQERMQQFEVFNYASLLAIDAMDKIIEYKIGSPIDLGNVYTFAVGAPNHNLLMSVATGSVADRFTVHPNSYEALCVHSGNNREDNEEVLILRPVECGYMALDDDLQVVDSNTCLYNCIYVWLFANRMITRSLCEFIDQIHDYAGVPRVRGELADEFVMKAVCDLYMINICTLSQAGTQQRISFASRSTLSGRNVDITSSICYLVNKTGRVHFNLLLPDL